MYHFIGAYWGSRPENREEIAKKLLSFIEEISVFDASLLHWHMATPKAEKKNPPPPKLTKEYITSVLKMQKTDFGSIPMPEIGFGLMAWTKSNAKFDATLSATCGVYSERINNSVLLNFNKLKPLPPKYLLRDIFAIMVKIFDPDKAVINFSGNNSDETGPFGALVAPPLEYYEKRTSNKSDARNKDSMEIF